MIKKALFYLFEKVMLAISFIGVVFGIVVLVSLVSHLFDETYPKIAHGTNYIFLTLLIFGGFSLWQYFEMRKWFAPNPNSIGGKISVILFLLSILFAVIVLAADLVGFYGPAWLKPYGTNGTLIFQTQLDDNFLVVLINSFVDAGFIAGLTFAGISFFLRFGIFTSGLSFCVALHNYFNGMPFNLSSLYNIFFETTLPEIWGMILTLGQFLISTFIGNKLGVST